MATPGQGRIERRLAAILADGMRRREFIGLLTATTLYLRCADEVIE